MSALRAALAAACLALAACDAGASMPDAGVDAGGDVDGAAVGCAPTEGSFVYTSTRVGGDCAPSASTGASALTIERVADGGGAVLVRGEGTDVFACPGALEGPCAVTARCAYDNGASLALALRFDERGGVTGEARLERASPTACTATFALVGRRP